MNEVWNLDPIYKGFDDPAFEADLNALKATVAEYAAFSAELSAAEPAAALRKGIDLQETIQKLANKMGDFSMFRQSTNSRDSEAGSQMGRVMSAVSATAAPDAAYREWASKLPNLMELVEADEKLQDYRFVFENILEGSRYLLGGVAEEVMARMSMSGGNAWSDLQSYMTSTVPVT